MALTDRTYSSVAVNNAAGAAAVNIQDGGNSITVDGTVAATQSGTWILGANSGVDIGDVTVNNASGASAVNIQDGGNSITVDGTVSIGTALPTGTNTIGDVTVSAVLPGSNAANLGKQADGARPSNGVGVAALGVRNDSLGSLVTTDLDYSEFSVDSAGRQYIAGQVSNGSSVAGNPVQVAGEARTSEPTAVSTGTAVRMFCDLIGRPVVTPYATPARSVDGRASATTATTTQVIAAQGSGIRTYITAVTVSNSDAVTGNLVTLSDGSSRYDIFIPPNSTTTVNFPYSLRGGDNAAWSFITGSAATTTYCSMSGYIANI